MDGESLEEAKIRHAEYARMMKVRMDRPGSALRKRQRERSLITAGLLFGFVVLVFLISVAKIKLNW